MQPYYEGGCNAIGIFCLPIDARKRPQRRLIVSTNVPIHDTGASTIVPHAWFGIQPRCSMIKCLSLSGLLAAQGTCLLILHTEIRGEWYNQMSYSHGPTYLWTYCPSDTPHHDYPPRKRSRLDLYVERLANNYSVPSTRSLHPQRKKRHVLAKRSYVVDLAWSVLGLQY